PVDPRQLNPDIPDEVAAILGRMMAKDPRQRYQRPEHLVQHLIQATQRLGGASGNSDGVLFVDAALPAPPQTRPLLVVGCAAAIVVVLVLLVGPTHESRAPGPGPVGALPGVFSDQGPAPPKEGQPPGERGPDGVERQRPAPPVVEDERIRKELASWKDVA